MGNVRAIVWAFDTDPAGEPLALVIFEDQTHQRFYHEELEA